MEELEVKPLEEGGAGFPAEAAEAPAEATADPATGETQAVDGAAETPEAAAETAGAEPDIADAAGGQMELPVAPTPEEDAELKAALEAIVYVTEEPATAAQIAGGLGKDEKQVQRLLLDLVTEFSAAGHGVMIREVAGGFKMATKPEHHEAVRAFARSLKAPLKLSLAALETLATIAYKQPITAPEIMEIRGVQGAGVLKTLLDRKLIQTSGRKNVIGRPILYKTTKEFLIQFGLKDLSELPTLKEFEELRRLAAGDSEEAQPAEGENGAPAPAGAVEEQREAVAAEPAMAETMAAETTEPSTAAEGDPAAAAAPVDEAPAAGDTEPEAASAPDAAAGVGEAPAAAGEGEATVEAGTENA